MQKKLNFKCVFWAIFISGDGCIRSLVCVWVCVFMCAWMCVRACVCVCVWVYVCVSVCLCVCVHLAYRSDTQKWKRYPEIDVYLQVSFHTYGTLLWDVMSFVVYMRLLCRETTKFSNVILSHKHRSIKRGKTKTVKGNDWLFECQLSQKCEYVVHVRSGGFRFAQYHKFVCTVEKIRVFGTSMHSPCTKFLVLIHFCPFKYVTVGNFRSYC